VGSLCLNHQLVLLVAKQQKEEEKEQLLKNG